MTAFLRTPVNYQSPYTAASLPAHYKQSTTTICACLHAVSPVDGTVKAATTWSRNLTNVPGYPGVTFKSTNPVSASNVETQQGQSPTNMELNFFLLASGISEADAQAGKWTHALCTVFVTNYEALKMGQYITHRGYFGQMRQMGKQIAIEILGFNQALAQQYGLTTRAECSRTYGDSWCTLDLAARGEIKTGTLTSVTSQNVFVDSGRSEADDYFGNGEFTFTSGNNNHYTFKIDAYDGAAKKFTLRTPVPYLPIVGDAYSAKRGCRKRPEDCLDRGNTINTDFFPYMPSLESLSRLPLS